MQEMVGGPRPKSLCTAKSPFGPCTDLQWSEKNTCIIGVNLFAATFPIPKGWSKMAPKLELEVIPLHPLLEAMSVIWSRSVKRYNVFFLTDGNKFSLSIQRCVDVYSVYFSPCSPTSTNHICKTCVDLGPLHTRNWEPVTITHQALSLVENAKAIQVHFTLRLRDQWSMWMHFYMALNGSCFMVIWTIFKNHLLEVGLTQNRETNALWTLTTVGLFYFIVREDPHE